MLSRTGSYASLLATSVAVLALCVVDAAARPRHGNGQRLADTQHLGGPRLRSKRVQAKLGQLRPGDTQGKPGHSNKPPKRGDDDARPPKHVSDETAGKRPRDRFSCDGGRLIKARCICPSGERVRNTGQQNFACEAIVVNKPPKSDGDRPRVTRQSDPPRPTIVASGGRAPPAAPPRSVGALPLSGPIPATPPATFAAVGGEAFPKEVVVTIAANAPESTEDQIARQFNVEIVERSTLSLVGIRAIRCRWRAGASVPAILARMRSDPRLIDVQANYIYRPSQGVSASPSNDLQYALAKLELSDAHTLSTGRGARIAIIDSGVDVTHPDLGGVTIDTFNALGGGTAEPGTHGTAIAGIIAARGVMRGIAPAATLMSVRAFPSDQGRQPQMTTTFVLLKAMEWSIANGARVVNLSLTGPRDPLMEKAVIAAAQKGVMMVAAAGNNGDKAPPAYPAAYADVIAVTAIDARDALYARANHGAYIAIAAPGVDVLAPARGKGHGLQSGTSFAAAHVSGILALMLERNPTITADAARRALMDSAVDLGAPGHDHSFGAGRTSAAAALRWMAK